MDKETPSERPALVEMAFVEPVEPINCPSCGQPLMSITWLTEFGKEPADGDVGITRCCASALWMSMKQRNARRMTVDEFVRMPEGIAAATATVLNAHKQVAALELAVSAVRKAQSH